MPSRRASHAGSWYNENEYVLPPPLRKTIKKGAANLNSTTLTCDKSEISRLQHKKLLQKVGVKITDSSRLNTTCAGLIHEGSFSEDYEDLEKKLAFNDYLQTLFLDALVDEKIESEKTEIDIKMAELAKRFEINKVILDKTNSRLKEISFLSEQQRCRALRQLDAWLSKADLTHGPARAIIAPHAGYSYCGACAAFAYRQVSPVVVKRIFILGPSHHVRLSGCALSQADRYKTPLYDLHIDKQVYTELEGTGEFTWMDMGTDEDEHSIEMHLPYIAKVMEEYKNGFTIIPILVGSLTPDKEAKYGRLLAPYLADPQNLFVVSSDFCHWGTRFRHTHYDKQCGHIHQSIENLDKQGMDIIETMNPQAFTDYLSKYGNTICGRHPIGVLLQACGPLSRQRQCSLKFLKYAQSSQCRTLQDSSVSYASASLLVD